MKKTLILIILFLMPAAVHAQGAYGRVSLGHNNIVGIGAGYRFSEHFSLGIEADGWSDFCGIAGGVDARYHFSDWKVRPFADLMAGYGYLGENYNCQKCYGFVTRAMAGAGWKWLDLGAGITIDPFYKTQFVATLSFTFPSFKEKRL